LVAGIAIGAGAGGCECRKPAPLASVSAGGAGSAGSAGSASDVPSAAGPTGSHIQLPRSDKAAVRPTRRPLDAAQLERLAALEFPDFERKDRTAPAGAIEVRHITRERPKLAVTVTIGRCNAQSACAAMDLAAWSARRDELLEPLPAPLRTRPDTRLEIGAAQIAGAPAIGIYELGYATATDDHDQPETDYIDAYVLIHNDGVNHLRVMAHYVDDAPPGGLAGLTAMAPQDDLAKLAMAFASYYLHAWN
jgi:hypothetical protein